jgi:integrase
VLTDTALKALKPGVTPYKKADEKGLFVSVRPDGALWWRFRYRYEGREKLLSFGTYPDTSLRKARERRDEARKLLAEGIDPSERRRARKAAQADSFDVVAREWLGKQKRLSSGTVELAERRLERWAFPYIGKMPVCVIEPPDVLRLLRRVEAAGRHETAHRVRQRIGQIFRYAIATGRATRDPTADLKGALAPVATRHRAAITDPAGVADLLRVIDGYTGQPATRAALRLLAVTFVRPGELRTALWPEFDLDAATWRIPAERMKMKREHLVPLSRQAVEILRELLPLTGHRPFVFESLRPRRPLSENTLNAALRTMGYSGEVMTAHGFRALASTLLHEQGWPPEVIELQLAHAQRSQVAAAYNRSARLQERIRMMQAWTDYVDALKRGNVVSLGRGRV